jgi:hypothetical protein
MKRIGLYALALLGIVLAPLLATAQNLPAKLYWAEQFNNWSQISQSANTYTFNGNCRNTPATDGTASSYFVFGNPLTPTFYPVLILDASPANSEIVTPTSLSTVSGSCGFAASTVNQHISFTLYSGTAGLQDAVGTLSLTATTGQPAVVALDRYWYGLVAALPTTPTVQSASTIIAGLKGAQSVQIVDTTTAPWTYYTWSGTAYVLAQTTVAAPAVAAGTGAGTAPTIAIKGNAEFGTVTLTTGTTPTASGPIFTLTWVAASSGGFSYAPFCSITSIGTKTYNGTNASVAGPAVDTYTATATALTASVAGYVWNYSCR